MSARKDRPFWTPEDDAWLRTAVLNSRYPRSELALWAAHLKRSPDAVRRRCVDLGLSMATIRSISRVVKKRA